MTNLMKINKFHCGRCLQITKNKAMPYISDTYSITDLSHYDDKSVLCVQLPLRVQKYS